MCEECEEAALTAVYVRKANRHGWRPPAAAATMPRLDDGRAAGDAAPLFVCEAVAGDTAAKVEPCA